MSDGYDPQKSRVAEDTLADFLRAPLTGDLTEVPGIGKAAVTKLGAEGEDGEEAVTNTFQLIGKFLMLKVRLQWSGEEGGERDFYSIIACRPTRTTATTASSRARPTATPSGSGSSPRASRPTEGEDGEEKGRGE
jgi:hypothetical protein